MPALIEAEQGLFTWLSMAAAAHPERIVARFAESDPSVHMTLSELEEESRRLAKGLASIGVSDGEIVALWLPNCREWLVSQFASSALGTAVLGLNTRYRSSEVSHLLQTVPVSAIVLPSFFLDIDFLGTIKSALHELREADPGFECPKLVFLGEVPNEALLVSNTTVRYDDLIARGSFIDIIDKGTAMSNLFTTSGSTSAPKVAGHNQTSILRHSLAAAAALDVQPGDEILAVLPLCGVFGFSAMMALIVGGGSALLVEVFNAEGTARALEQFEVTHVVGGDEMLGAIFSKVPEGRALPTLRRGGIANFAGRAKEVVVEADERWGAKISGVYGSSELFALTALWPASAPITRRGLGGGVVVDVGIQFRVRDIDTDEPVADGVSGELQFLGYNTIEGYLNNPNATVTSFASDGWFKSGDLGYLDDGGFVYQCRAREALRLHGFLVEPGEIEDYLSSEPSIEEVHVVGVETATRVKTFAFARPRPGETIDESAVLALARQRIAAYKIPDHIIQVKEFPTTTGTNGTKVRFDELRDLAQIYLSNVSDA